MPGLEMKRGLTKEINRNESQKGITAAMKEFSLRTQKNS
jgi:hypothetical protein